MIRNTIAAALLLAVAVVIGGCFSVSTLRTAQVVPEGDAEVALAVEVPTIPTGGDEGNGGALSGEDSEFVPQVVGRYGVTDGLDLGLRAGKENVGIEAGVAVFDSDAFDVTLVPSLNFAFLRYDTVLGVALANLLFDASLTDGLTLTLGLKGGQFFDPEPFEGEAWLLGGMVGLAVEVADGVAVMPAVDVLAPVEQLVDDPGEVYVLSPSVSLFFQF